MKGRIAIALAVVVLLSSTAAAGQSLIAKNWMKVDENHAQLQHEGQDYVLDSYVVPFQQPYYIHVRLKNGQPLDTSRTEAVAEDYIKPRGCTEPLVRRKDLDRSSGDGREQVLGYQC